MKLIWQLASSTETLRKLFWIFDHRPYCSSTHYTATSPRFINLKLHLILYPQNQSSDPPCWLSKLSENGNFILRSHKPTLFYVSSLFSVSFFCICFSILIHIYIQVLQIILLPSFSCSAAPYFHKMLKSFGNYPCRLGTLISLCSQKCW